MDDLKKSHTWLTSDDFDHMAYALANIQYTFDLLVKDIANGKLDSIQTNTTLTPDDLVLIVKEMIQHPGKHFTGVKVEFAMIVEWLEATLE